MSKQNPTIEDSKKYKDLIEGVKIANKRANNFDELWYKSEREVMLLRRLIKQFHYGPVNGDYIALIKSYVEEHDL